jgi:hypothetical protein
VFNCFVSPKACCALHNWLCKSDSKTYLTVGSVDEERTDTSEFIPGRWRSEVTQMEIRGNTDGDLR